MSATVLAEVSWPAEGDASPPGLPGFMVSSFSPLAAEVADRCLRQVHGEPPAPPDEAARTAIVLVSVRGDLQTGSAVAAAVDAGRKVAPLLFFQSVPNAVVGHIAKRWGLAGPVLCTNPVGDPLADALDVAELLIADGDADRALLVLLEQSVADGEPDRARALLVAR